MMFHIFHQNKILKNENIKESNMHITKNKEMNIGYNRHEFLLNEEQLFNIEIYIQEEYDDDICHDIKKCMALKLYYVLMCNGLNSKESIYEIIDDMFHVSDHALRDYKQEFEFREMLSKDQRGYNAKSECPMTDKSFKEEFRNKLCALTQSKQHFTTQTVANWVNSELLPKYDKYKESEKYAAETIGRWMHNMEWTYGKITKGIYVDGHEREDVVEARNEYITKYQDRKQFTVTYKDEECSETEQENEDDDIKMIDANVVNNGIDKNGILWKRLFSYV